MGDFGLKILKAGAQVNVGEAGLKNLAYYSKYPLLKVKAGGTGTITYTHDGASTDALVVTHNLGYKPLFTFYTQWYNIDSDAKETSYRPAPFYDQLLGGAVVTRARVYSSTTALRYEIGSYTGSGTASVSLDYFYEVYYDPDTGI